MKELADELLGKAPNAEERRLARQMPAGSVLIAPQRVSFTIFGQPPAHKNGYRIVSMGERPAIVKSKEAIEYVKAALLQIPPQARLRLEGPIYVEMTIWYRSERADLDESLVLDIMQDRWAPAHGAHGKRELLQAGVYRNDRQVRRKLITHSIDSKNPRAVVTIETFQPQQAALL